MLIKEVDKPEVYLSDGFVYRHILDPSALAALQTVLKAQGQSTTVIVVPAGSIAAGVFGKPVAAAPAVDVAALAAALAKLLPTQACVCDCDCANCALTTADIAAAFRHVLDNTKLGPLA